MVRHLGENPDPAMIETKVCSKRASSSPEELPSMLGGRARRKQSSSVVSEIWRIWRPALAAFITASEGNDCVDLPLTKY